MGVLCIDLDGVCFGDDFVKNIFKFWDVVGCIDLFGVGFYFVVIVWGGFGKVGEVVDEVG